MNLIMEESEKKEIVEKTLEKSIELGKEGRFKEGLIILSMLLSIEPDNYKALIYSGIMCDKMNAFKKAVSFYEQAISLYPDKADIYNNAALSYGSMGMYEKAIEYYEKCMSINPSIHCWNNIGIAYRQMGKWDLAESALKKSLQEDNPHNWLNLGGLYGDKGDLKLAQECFEKAIKIKPDFHAAHVDLAHTLALQGNLSDSWEHYEHRLHHFKQCKKFENYGTYWDGKASGSLLVWCEQGMGDLFNFLRFVPRHAVLKAPECCADLLRNNGYNVTTSRIETDFHCSIMSLPYLLGSELECEPYIKAEPLDLGPGFKVGICWAGNPQHPNDSIRSIAVSKLKSILSIEGVRFINLQKDMRKRVYVRSQGEEIDLAEGIENLPIEFIKISSFQDTASIIAGLDAVVTVDTVVLHLAAAMGKPTYGMIAKKCDWRWGINGTDTLWYPSLKLIRSDEFNGWGNVVETVREELVSIKG